MKNLLTICLLTKNNRQVLPELFDSFTGTGRFLVGDMGSTDGSKIIYEKYAAQHVQIKDKADMSTAKNELLTYVKTPWVLFVEPWEKLVTDLPDIANLKHGDYNVQVLDNGVISKATRLWHTSANNKFVNPVYEIIDSKSPMFADCILYSGTSTNLLDGKSLLKKWRADKPTSPLPMYYEAFSYLEDKNYDEFIRSTQNYLFMENTGVSAVMMRYYLACVYLYVKNDFRKAMAQAQACVGINPLMAEFWCILGDVLYATRNYRHSFEMYENAKIMGTQRLKSDPWPFHIVKYQEYPEKMQQNCMELLKTPLPTH